MISSGGAVPCKKVRRACWKSGLGHTYGRKKTGMGMLQEGAKALFSVRLGACPAQPFFCSMAFVQLLIEDNLRQTCAHIRVTSVRVFFFAF